MSLSFSQSARNQNWKRNQIELVWDISRKFGARIRYRYGDQEVIHVNNFTTGDVDTWLVHGHTAILGLWAKPIHGMRLNFDWEHTNNDNTIVRISPRKESRYRVQAGYTPRPWAVLGASVNIVDDHNDAFLVDYVGHNRNYGFTASLAPPDSVSVLIWLITTTIFCRILWSVSKTPGRGHFASCHQCRILRCV